MRSMAIAIAILALVGFSREAGADHERHNRCKFCVKLYDKCSWERTKVVETKKILTGYRNVLVRYENGFETKRAEGSDKNRN